MKDIKGDGTQTNPYLIEHPEDLILLEESSDYFKLNNDIDMNEITTNSNGIYYNEGNGWAPINFYGQLDGDGHTIYNLHGNSLFYDLDGATVKNLKIENASIYGDNAQGIMAFSFIDAVVENVAISNSEITSDTSSVMAYKIIDSYVSDIKIDKVVLNSENNTGILFNNLEMITDEIINVYNVVIEDITLVNDELNYGYLANSLNILADGDFNDENNGINLDGITYISDEELPLYYKIDISLSNNITKLFHTQLKKLFNKTSKNAVVGVLIGAAATAIVQSSGATTIMIVGFVNTGIINLFQATSMIMGANIGTTITAQIIRLGSIEAGDNWLLWLFDTDTLAPIALVAGIILIMFIKSKSTKTIGDICIGFGILFVGLNLMTSGVKPLIGTDAFTSFIDILSNPLLGILFGLVLTVIVQSSSATVGMLQTVASVPGSGITFAMAYPIIMGINLGTCVTTAMVCSIGSSKNAKRTGVVHIAFNTIGTVLFMLVMTVLQKMEVFGTAYWVRAVDSGVIANFQTVFNLLTAVALIPFTNIMVKISMMIVKEEKEKPHRHPELHTLDEKLYISPAVAVMEATKAVAAMGGIAKANFAKCCEIFINGEVVDADQINSDEECLDSFADRCDHFLIGLSKAVETEKDDRQVDMLLQTVPSFERVGDYATNLVELAERLQAEKGSFSENAKKELGLLCAAINEILDITVAAFASNDNVSAKTIEPLEETIDDMIMILKDRHTKRLKAGECSIGSGLVFMEALTHLERASDHCSSIAVMMLARENEEILHNHYAYLHELHKGKDKNYRNERNRRREQYIEPLKAIQ